MRKLTGKSLIAVSVLALAVAAVAGAQEAEKAPKPPKPVSVYRVDFAIHESENGQRVNTRSYTQLMEEDSFSRVRAGARVPITTGQGMQYMDVGVRLDCKLAEREGSLQMELTLEITSFAREEAQANPLLRNIGSEVRTAVLPGKPTVVTSIDDTASKRRYELEVTATKIK